MGVSHTKHIDQLNINFVFLFIPKKKVLLKLNSGYYENLTTFAMLAIYLIGFEKFWYPSICMDV